MVGIRVVFAQHQYQDSVIVPASEKYTVTSPLRILFIGENYRKEWTQPVKIPVLNLRREQGGLVIVDSGGGKQTNNLRLTDRFGNEWTLRSVDKDIEKSMLEPLKNTIVETLMQEFQTALHPYAALTIPVLAKAAGVTVSDPRIFYIPDDPTLGKYGSLLANSVCFLEKREPTPDHSETKSTNTVQHKITDETDHRLLQKSILRARLLDMLIGDWDRHEDQWRWGVKDSAGTQYYYPIPRDRDFVYFRSTGLFVKFASIFFQPYMRGFSRTPRALHRLNAKIIHIDQQWLNELDAEDWKTIIATFQKNVTDSVIEKAVKQMPPEIYSLSGNGIVLKLKSRRDALMKHGMRYYKFLTSHTVIEGSDEIEFFRISSDGKNICVSVQEKSPGQKTIYQRTFNPDETKKISIRGLGGDDQFLVTEDVSSLIRLNLEGGDGKDAYHVNGKIRTRIDDRDKPGKFVLARKL